MIVILFLFPETTTVSPSAEASNKSNTKTGGFWSSNVEESTLIFIDANLLPVGITALVAIHVIINVAVVTSSMPATGMPLPFFSYRRNSIIYFIVWNGNFT